VVVDRDGGGGNPCWSGERSWTQKMRHFGAFFVFAGSGKKGEGGDAAG